LASGLIQLALKNGGVGLMRSGITEG